MDIKLEDRQSFYTHPKVVAEPTVKKVKFRDIEHIISDAEFIT